MLNLVLDDPMGAFGVFAGLLMLWSARATLTVTSFVATA